MQSSCVMCSDCSGVSLISLDNSWLQPVEQAAHYTGSPSLASDTVARAARDKWIVADSPLNGCMGLMPQTKEPQTKRDGHKSMTDRQKKTSPPRRRVKSKPHQPWYGDRGPRTRSRTSKTFGGLTHSFAARGTENLGVTRPRQIKTLITP